MDNNDQVKSAQVLEGYIRSRQPWWTKLSKVCAFVLFIAVLSYGMIAVLGIRDLKLIDGIVIAGLTFTACVLGNMQ